MRAYTYYIEHNGIPSKDLEGLMEIYECSYIRLRNLVPDLDLLSESNVSKAGNALDLTVRVVERCKFTSTLNLTYHFDDEEGAFPAPDMTVRIYHDAQLAEVIACGRRRGNRHAIYNRMYNRYTLLEKWRMNRFLQKWLGYCLLQGHRFNTGVHRRSALSFVREFERAHLITES
jgi:uncharacterized protein YqiB (DUF1249 family)